MNKIILSDNLIFLKSLPSESIDLIYIDPPFNTGKTQAITTIRTVRSENGDRKGFQGNSYQTTEIGTKAYQDSFNVETDGLIPLEKESAYNTLAPESSIFFLEKFLRPRLVEAYRILKPHGSLYFHIDYREVHYCKLLLDNIFGRDCFLNEIIWAYDFGGKPRSKWPAKHDNILFYVKSPEYYIFNPNEIETEDYMAPGLVGPEKVKNGKRATDTFWWPYVGTKGKRISDTWWMTIVGTNSKERFGYPTQKPYRLTNRFIQASTHPGQVVLDFFAGSGTIGESCLRLNRKFILVDNNPQSLEVMARRFAGFNNIEWVNFDPKPFYKTKSHLFKEINERSEEDLVFPEPSPEFQMLAATASNLQEEWEEKSDLWKGSPFEWIVQLPARSKGKLARRLISTWFVSKGLQIDRIKDSSEVITIKNLQFAIKFSTLWTTGHYKFQQIRKSGPDFVICFGISPFEVHCWVLNKEYAIKNGTQQHKGASEYLITINPSFPPQWVLDHGGSLEQASQVLKNITKTK